MSSYPRALPVGDRAVTVEFGDAIDLRLNAAVRALDRSLEARPLPGLVETVPTYRSLLVLFDPRLTVFDDLAARVLERAREVEAGPLRSGALRTIETVYGGEDGPDLPEVAQACRISEEDVVRLHLSSEVTAFMLGFMPGFAYLGETPKGLAVPRRATPRVRVPAGSVGLAGRQTGVYPAASPGGWRLIGRTAARLFDPFRDPPALIQPGDRVRFVRTGAPLEARTPAPPQAATDALAVVEVLEPGLLTSVQAGPRRGHRRLGVSEVGPLDPASHAAANGVVGNSPSTAALEATLVGPTLRFVRSTRFALGGADLGAVLDRADLGPWPVPRGEAVLARAGNVLRFEGRRGGCRVYIAFAGGLDVPPALGAHSTDLLAGFGGHSGRALRAGDVLAVRSPPSDARLAESSRALASASFEQAHEAVGVRAVLGPQSDHFDASAMDRFFEATWAVTAASDRVGLRLSGPPLATIGSGEIVSDGMVPGCIQVPPDGQPIVMLADGPTTGGYPKIATVVAEDVSRLGQLVPGASRVRFERRVP